MSMENNARQGGLCDIVREDKILRTYKRSRYFNLIWFRKNHSFANRVLTFGDEVKDITDLSKYSIFRSTYGNVIDFKFTNNKTGTVTHIKINKFSHNVLNVKKKDAFYNPFVWVVANQMKYIEFPKKWKVLESIYRGIENKIDIVEHIENGVVKVRIYNLHHKHVLLDIEEIEGIVKMYTDKKRLQNLKPFSQKIFLKAGLNDLKRG